jgi:hypothetical protein
VCVYYMCIYVYWGGGWTGSITKAHRGLVVSNVVLCHWIPLWYSISSCSPVCLSRDQPSRRSCQIRNLMTIPYILKFSQHTQIYAEKSCAMAHWLGTSAPVYVFQKSVCISYLHHACYIPHPSHVLDLNILKWVSNWNRTWTRSVIGKIWGACHFEQ